MLIEWTTLTPDQRRALLHMANSPNARVSEEICEQLRNLGLAERAGPGLVISSLGRCVVPQAA
ncbi:hypothetical protein SAMN02983003_0213 [Devosia enhydra]|uniref:Uncharacterized protein n=1 Tax=Devosia enhydra TaxID=665118 RepID=A0A1K2HT82_9HYPH|nr:hypothetical protein [Devosia enhydra]SFZ80930.1 hypothetical protein SAMN02983003_0213 [Devosia enhydra]